MFVVHVLHRNLRLIIHRWICLARGVAYVGHVALNSGAPCQGRGLRGVSPAWARVSPFRLCSSFVHSLSHLLLFITFSLFPFFIHFTYFLLLSIRSLSTRIVPLRFQAWGSRMRPNLGLVCFVLWLCYLYCLVKNLFWYCVVFGLV